MTSEAVELVRRGYEAYESDGVEGIISFLDPGVEWRNPPDSPIAGVFHGHDGVREWQLLANEAFEEMVRNGKAVSFQMYSQVADARVAVGLSE